ncbi:hypothetical protein BDZ45DRAFT_675018 [Acephala macrosclerotiorum]|nr:hypothetical protein BDZ45DRAFT_675018 [Acephala macrosclerotiorum]
MKLFLLRYCLFDLCLDLPHSGSSLDSILLPTLCLLSNSSSFAFPTTAKLPYCNFSYYCELVQEWYQHNRQESVFQVRSPRNLGVKDFQLL